MNPFQVERQLKACRLRKAKFVRARFRLPPRSKWTTVWQMGRKCKRRLVQTDYEWRIDARGPTPAKFMRIAVAVAPLAPAVAAQLAPAFGAQLAPAVAAQLAPAAGAQLAPAVGAPQRQVPANARRFYPDLLTEIFDGRFLSLGIAHKYIVKQEWRKMLKDGNVEKMLDMVTTRLVLDDENRYCVRGTPPQRMNRLPEEYHNVLEDCLAIFLVASKQPRFLGRFNSVEQFRRVCRGTAALGAFDTMMGYTANGRRENSRALSPFETSLQRTLKKVKRR